MQRGGGVKDASGARIKFFEFIYSTRLDNAL